MSKERKSEREGREWGKRERERGRWYWTNGQKATNGGMFVSTYVRI